VRGRSKPDEVDNPVGLSQEAHPHNAMKQRQEDKQGMGVGQKSKMMRYAKTEAEQGAREEKGGPAFMAGRERGKQGTDKRRQSRRARRDKKDPEEDKERPMRKGEYCRKKQSSPSSPLLRETPVVHFQQPIPAIRVRYLHH
jgi:hypothetical protein